MPRIFPHTQGNEAPSQERATGPTVTPVPYVESIFHWRKPGNFWREIVARPIRWRTHMICFDRITESNRGPPQGWSIPTGLMRGVRAILVTKKGVKERGNLEASAPCCSPELFFTAQEENRP